MPLCLFRRPSRIRSRENSKIVDPNLLAESKLPLSKTICRNQITGSYYDKMQLFLQANHELFIDKLIKEVIVYSCKKEVLTKGSHDSAHEWIISGQSRVIPNSHNHRSICIPSIFKYQSSHITLCLRGGVEIFRSTTS